MEDFSQKASILTIPLIVCGFKNFAIKGKGRGRKTSQGYNLNALRKLNAKAGIYKVFFYH